MKALHWLLYLGLATSLTAGLTACSSSKTVAGEKVTKLKEPFSERKYRSNKRFFRAVGSAESSNLNFSKENALFNARKELASNVQSTMKGVTERYAGERNIADKMEFSQRFQDLTREVLDTKIVGVRTLGEQSFKKENNRFLTYVAIEIDMESFYFSITEKIATRKEIKQNWDADQFRKVYNEEMERIERMND